MKISVSPSKFKGSIIANPSKSVMQRAIALAALSEGETNIFNFDSSNDTMAALEVALAMGCSLEHYKDRINIINSNNSKKLASAIWNVGESGLSTRMFSPVAGLFDQDVTITGERSLLKRPMNSLIEGLTKLGLKVKHNNFHLPLEINGKISNFNLDLDLSSGSQVLTGLLIALSMTRKDSTIKVRNLASKPYIDLTLELLKDFGIEIINENYEVFHIAGNQKLERQEYFVEGDWSGAAFHLVGGAISGNAIISNLNSNSKQADRAILSVLEQVGAIVSTDYNSIKVKKNKLNPFNFDATDCPDLFPPLAVLAANCNDVCKIKGIHRLTHKESNRFLTLQQEFSKCGIKINSANDYMIIEPGNANEAVTDSHNDHRIAMSMATLGITANGKITIENAECINKSYPNYFNDYVKLGGNIN